MVRDAHESLTGEDAFKSLKQKKAAEALKIQWKESIQTKNAKKVIAKMFD